VCVTSSRILVMIHKERLHWCDIMKLKENDSLIACKFNLIVLIPKLIVVVVVMMMMMAH
jgi:hypothetical protein